MIKMEMAAQHVIDLLRTDSCIRQPLQEGAVFTAMPMCKVFACFVVADTTIDENGVMLRTNQKTLNRNYQTAGDG
jgi:hypothetical protein